MKNPERSFGNFVARSSRFPVVDSMMILCVRKLLPHRMSGVHLVIFASGSEIVSIVSCHSCLCASRAATLDFIISRAMDCRNDIEKGLYDRGYMILG